METTDVLEKAHKGNVDKLLEEFGQNRKNEILETYNNMRKSAEKSAKIRDFTPIFLYRTLREALRTDGKISIEA
ncbi:MAG: hypothetical protein WAX07_09690 [Candidatus Altiarchaeia archaeon]